MTFDLPSLLAAHAGEGSELHSRYLNPQLPRTLRTIGFDKNYVRGEGAYLFDAEDFERIRAEGIVRPCSIHLQQHQRTSRNI